MLKIGIDTGVNTGFAVWDTSSKALLEVSTLKIHQAMLRVKELSDSDETAVYFEDARLRKWLPRERNLNEYRGKLMGAGAVKRDAAIWEDFLTDLGVEWHAVAPKNNTTKLNATFFEKITGWKGRTSEHARDAAMLVFNR